MLRDTSIRDDGVAGTSTLDELPDKGTVGLYNLGSSSWTKGAALFLPGWL